jgi:hypothetical protein
VASALDSSTASLGQDTASPGQLPELASVYWRPRASDERLRHSSRLWTLTTVAHTVPFIGAAALLFAISPVTIPVALVLLAHAWVIPELYASRGAGVVRCRPKAGAGSERTALLLLGDLLDTSARELQLATGLAPERGRLGVWLVGEAGALLVRPGGRRVLCYCVKATDAELPSGDKIAHLLLALRTDEEGFATVANLAFSGAVWRLRRRLGPERRPALDTAVALARGGPRGETAVQELCTGGQCGI